MDYNNNEENSNMNAESVARAKKIRAIHEAVHSGRSPKDADIPASMRNNSAQIKPVHLVKKNVTEPPSPPPRPHNQKKKVKKKRKKKKTFSQKVRSLFPEKGDSILECIRKIIFLISIIAIIVCAYLVADYYIDLWQNSMRNKQIGEIYEIYKPERGNSTILEVNEDDDESEKYYEALISAQKLLDLNSEYVGFITLPTINGDDVFALPIVRSEDNVKYLNRSFLGTDSRAGTLFMDFRNNFDEVVNHHLSVKNSDNIVIYGHNMGDDSMFGALKYYYRNADYYDNHPIIYLDSRYETYTYKIFAFFILDAFDETETKFDCWNKLEFSDEYDFYKFVNEAKRRTIRTNDVDVQYGDKLLTLSTCNTLLGDNGRLIVMARQVRPGEYIYEGTENSQANNNIKWPTMYFRTRTNEYYDPNAPFTPYGAESEAEE